MAASNADLPDPDDVPSECTEYTTDVELIDKEQDDDEFYFGFICPRCDDTNLLRGDPRAFANKPFRCMNCNYVPLLESDALHEFASKEFSDE